MIYLSGTISNARHHNLGWMLTPRSRYLNIPPGPWAADTGCYKHPDIYNRAGYLRWLQIITDIAGHGPLFATAPDRFADAAGTLRAALPELEHIRRVALVALVAQDGMKPEDIPWEQIDALFMGGTDHWKFGEHGRELLAAAKHNRVWTHLGRCNSKQRFLRAKYAGYHSADGTFLAFAPDQNWTRLQTWLHAAASQEQLPEIS